jgi:hypothetical protein
MTDELPLEPAHYDHYTIELRKGALHDEKTVRHHEAKTREDAIGFVEALRDAAYQRENVTWTGEEVDTKGHLYGMYPDKDIALIAVSPPLSEQVG